MIPAEVERCLKAVDAPSLFTQENREDCEAVHRHVRHAVEQGAETMTIQVDADLLAKQRKYSRDMVGRSRNPPCFSSCGALPAPNGRRLGLPNARMVKYNEEATCA